MVLVDLINGKAKRLRQREEETQNQQGISSPSEGSADQRVSRIASHLQQPRSILLQEQQRHQQEIGEGGEGSPTTPTGEEEDAMGVSPLKNDNDHDAASVSSTTIEQNGFVMVSHPDAPPSSPRSGSTSSLPALVEPGDAHPSTPDHHQHHHHSASHVASPPGANLVGEISLAEKKNNVDKAAIRRLRPKGPQVRTKLIPVEDEWREHLPSVMVQTNPDGSSTPIGIIKNLSAALSIEVTEDGNNIEIKAYEWQQLKEAEALLRMTFRDYDGVKPWWFYTIPSFVSTFVSGTKGTDVPEFSDPAVGLKCSIAPYDENSTRRAFFLTCPEWPPLNAAYATIRRAWNYWKNQSVEAQINAAMGVLYGVMISNIKADGNCLFRAFAHTILGDEERHIETRKAIVDFMRSNEELKSFIVSEDENDDTAAFADKYLDEMEKDGTWGDQIELTAFTRVYSRAVRIFSYNYSESRLIHVVTPLDEGVEAKGPEVWLLHLHGHYSLLVEGVAPIDAGWQRMLKEIEQAKGDAAPVGGGQISTALIGAIQSEQDVTRKGKLGEEEEEEEDILTPELL